MGEESEEFEEFQKEEDPLLKLEGMTEDLAKTFKEYGYWTIESIAIESPRILYEKIGERKGFSEDVARKIVKSALSKLNIRMMTLKEALQEETSRAIISTGSQALDKLLGGGIRTRELTGVSGEFGAGKSQLVYTIAINTITQLKGGVWVVDTEETFTARRVKQIAEARGYNYEKEIEPHFYFSRIYGTEHLIFMLQSVHKKIKEHQIRFIGVDTLLNPFRQEYVGRETLAPRQQLLNRCIRTLLNYARIYDLAVLITNQVVASPVATYGYTRPEMEQKPGGGHVFGHGVNNHLYLRKAGGATRIATLMDSSYLPWGECTFKVTEKGIEDVEEEKK